MPQASVIMPCYNHARFVGESVASILGQTFEDLELIVVDDKSQDGSVDLLLELAKKDARVKLILHDKNQGASRSRNDGLRSARGEYVAFCDADDLWKPDKLQRQVKLLTEHRDCDVTYCDSEIIDENGHLMGELFSDQFPLPPIASGDLFEVLCARNFINMTTVLVRRQAVGGQLFFDESVQWVEDWWQWIRLSRHYHFHYEPDALAQYRVHPQSTGFTRKPGISRNRWKVGRRNLQTHSDMPLGLQAVVWHQMGMELCLLGKKRRGCQFLQQALRCGWRGGVARLKLAKISARLGLEWSRRATK
jgi:glycosyltransferase involved in cell wall biosynthesis